MLRILEVWTLENFGDEDGLADRFGILKQLSDIASHERSPLAENRGTWIVRYRWRVINFGDVMIKAIVNPLIDFIVNARDPIAKIRRVPRDA